MKTKTILVTGRRWFDKVNGNTYCAAKAYINGSHVLTTDWTYGYDDFYLQLAGEELHKMGIIDSPRHSNGMSKSLWLYCSDNNIDFNYEVVDGLKRDLVSFSKDKPKVIS